MKKITLLWLSLLFSTSIFCQEWEQVSPIPLEFETLHHTVAFSFGQKGYVATGSDNSSAFGTPLFYEYDAPTDTWTQKEDFPWSFDPLTDTWTELESCPCTPRIHPAFVAINGKIYMGLGEGINGELKDWWEYDISSDSWTEKGEFPATERHHPYQFAIGDFVYVGFGHTDGNGAIYNDWYRYDPSNDDWALMSSLPAEGRVSGTQFSYGGKGYALSGQGEDHGSMAEGEFWQYDPVSDSWNSMPPHPKKSRYAPGSFVIDGYVYLIHGIYPDYQEMDGVIRFKLPEVVTAIDPLEVEEDITISPNPFSQEITFNLNDLVIKNDFEIRIYNSFSQVVFEQKMIRGNINLSFLPSGIYAVEIINHGKKYVRQIIKTPIVN